MHPRLRLRLDRITTQITAIVAVSVLLGIILTVTIFFILGIEGSRDSPVVTAERIVTLSQLANAADGPAELGSIVAAAHRAGIDVRQVALRELEPVSSDPGPLDLSGLVASSFDPQSGLEVIDGLRHPDGATDQLIVRLDDRTALIFEPHVERGLTDVIWRPAALAVSIVLLFVLFLSIYAVRWIVSPLSTLAEAAQSFGRSPADDPLIVRRGPVEITQVADALNDMRARIRTLIDDKTRMLVAISHDLRTPLTRLRLRSERVADGQLRAGMLHEIEQVSRMLDETLNFLRDDANRDQMSRVDLPSLLQTICAEYSDIGHDVSYEGPARLTWNCHSSALTRAVSNIVHNGVKHGSRVRVELSILEDSTAQIDVTDNGPGIPEAMHEKVFEPFFKADDSRGEDAGGFGLGLSIAKGIVQAHGGDISLVERRVGLTVRVILPKLV